MASSVEKIKKVTHALGTELLSDDAPQPVDYRLMPHVDGGERPIWRIELLLAFDTRQAIHLDLNGEVILGRAGSGENYIAMFDAVDADHLGVSRQHAMLRPTGSKLFLLDLNSTNGSWLNGHSIGVNTPYSLSTGDLITLGRLDVVVKIIDRPRGETQGLVGYKDNADMLTRVGCQITSQLHREQVIEQLLETTLSLTGAGEASIWLVDEQTGELFLEAGLNVEDHQIKRLPVNDTLPGRVIATGQPLLANRERDGDQVKVKTGYLVEAVIYVPLKQAGVTFGVLSAAHHEPGQMFSQHEERLMQSIAEFGSVAVQNARVHQVAERGLARRAKVLAALNDALAYEVKNRLNAIVGYGDLLAADQALDEDNKNAASELAEAGHQLSALVERFAEVTSLCEEAVIHYKPCDVINVVQRAVDDLANRAADRLTTINFQIVGEPYIIQADATRLYRSVVQLLDNAIKFSPPASLVWIGLIYGDNELSIVVRDNGPGIAEDELDYLFERYSGSRSNGDGEISLGLGLELVRATAEAHRGSVTVHNIEQGGAEFIVYLPATLRVV